MAQVTKIIERNPKAWIFSGLLHLGLIGFLMFGMQWNNDDPTPPVNIVNAVVVNEERVQEEINKLKKSEEKDKKKKQEEVDQHKKELEKLEKQSEQEQKHIEELKEAKKQEEEKRQDIVKKRKEEEKKLVEQRIVQEKAEKLAEKKRIEEEKKLVEVEKKEKEQKKQLAKKEAERKKAEAEAKAEKKAEAEAQATQQAAEAAKQAEADALAEQVSAEQNRMNQSTVDQYKALIKARIESHWVKPSNSTGLIVKVRVQVIPGGGIGSITILQSSGNPAFDMSVDAAIRQAEPIPLPPNPSLLDYFRVIDFTFGE